jgi:hypothetical protein
MGGYNNHMKKILLLLIIPYLFVSGCTTVGSITYYTSLNKDDSLIRSSNPLRNPMYILNRPETVVLALTGPGEITEITTSEVIVTIDSEPKFWFPVAMGPYLPVIPLFIFKYWADKDDSQKETINFDITIKNNDGVAQWDISKIKLIFPDGNEVSPLVCYKPMNERTLRTTNISEVKLKNDIFWTPEHTNIISINSGEIVKIDYNVFIKDIDSFKLKLDGLTIGDKAELFPILDLKKAKGYAVYGVPGL